MKRAGFSTAFAFTLLIAGTSAVLAQGSVRQQGQDVDLVLEPLLHVVDDALGCIPWHGGPWYVRDLMKA